MYAEALNKRSVCLTRRGRMDEAATLLQQAIEVALEHEVRASALRAFNNLMAVESLDNGCFDLNTVDRGLELARRVGRGWGRGQPCRLNRVAVPRFAWRRAAALADREVCRPVTLVMAAGGCPATVA